MSANKLRTMRGLLAGAGLHNPPVAKAPKPAPIPKAKSTIKLAKTAAAPKVKPAATKQFRFSNPNTVGTRIKRAERTEYLHPNANRSAGRLNRILNDVG